MTATAVTIFNIRKSAHPELIGLPGIGMFVDILLQPVTGQSLHRNEDRAAYYECQDRDTIAISSEVYNSGKENAFKTWI